MSVFLQRHTAKGTSRVPPFSTGFSPAGGAPGQQMPMGQQMPGQQMPTGQQMPGQMPMGQQMPGQQMPMGQQMPGQMPMGQQMPAQMPMGQQMPSQQMPGQQMPMGQQMPGQMPMGQQMPGQQMPMGQQMPGQQMPMGQQMPGQQMPMGQQMSGQQMPGQQMPMGQQMPAQQMPMGQQMPGQQMPMGQMPMGQVGMNPPVSNMPGQMGTGCMSLVKGQNMSLTKAAPGLRHALIGLGWDVRQTAGAAFDLDSSCFLLNAQNQVSKFQDFIFYNNKQSMDGSIVHHGDNLTGMGEGDDEQLSVDLMRVPPEVQRIVFVVSVYEAELRKQNFGMVERAFIRIVDQDTQQEIVRFDLTEDACMWNCMMFGELYRYGNEWKFKALGNGMQGGLKVAGIQYGIQLA